MVISVYISLCWFLIASFIVFAKKAAPRQLAFVLLIVDFVNTNLYYLFGETFHFFKISEKAPLYVSFSLQQSVIIPLFVAIMVIASSEALSFTGKAALHFVSVCFLIGLEALSSLFTIITFQSTLAMVLLLVYRLLLFYLSFPALKLFKRMCSHS